MTALWLGILLIASTLFTTTGVSAQCQVSEVAIPQVTDNVIAVGVSPGASRVVLLTQSLIGVRSMSTLQVARQGNSLQVAYSPFDSKLDPGEVIPAFTSLLIDDDPSSKTFGYYEGKEYELAGLRVSNSGVNANEYGFVSGNETLVRFGGPYVGLYRNADKEKVIVDTDNHCVRVDKNKQVLPLVGTCTQPGFADGAGVTGTLFKFPRAATAYASIVVDPSNPPAQVPVSVNNFYVSDDTGLRLVLVSPPGVTTEFQHALFQDRYNATDIRHVVHYSADNHILATECELFVFSPQQTGVTLHVLENFCEKYSHTIKAASNGGGTPLTLRVYTQSRSGGPLTARTYANPSCVYDPNATPSPTAVPPVVPTTPPPTVTDSPLSTPAPSSANVAGPPPESEDTSAVATVAAVIVVIVALTAIAAFAMVLRFKKKRDAQQQRHNDNNTSSTFGDTSTKPDAMNSRELDDGFVGVSGSSKGGDDLRSSDGHNTYSTSTSGQVTTTPVSLQVQASSTARAARQSREARASADASSVDICLDPDTAVPLIEAGDYVQLNKIGQGAFGAVHRVLLGNGVVVAAKTIMLPEDAVDAMDEITQEIKMMAMLRHPNIVAYYGCSLDADDCSMKLFIEYCSGGSLFSIAKGAKAALPETIARNYLRQVVEGLAFIHSQGIVHRDLKCGNVLLTSSGKVKIADFGTSKNVGRTMKSGAKMAQTLIGTPIFMAPEMIPSNDSPLSSGYTKKADIWSFGILCLEFMNRGNAPWPAFPNPAVALVHISSDRGVPIIPERLSEACQDFVLRCCDRNPETRSSAEELLQHPWLAGGSSEKNGTREPELLECEATV